MTSHMRFSYYCKYYMRIKENRESVICQINHSISKQHGKCLFIFSKNKFQTAVDKWVKKRRYHT